jgi:PilZ domain
MSAMNRVAVPADLRKHPRAQLRLPARLRWRGPLGMRFTTAHTVNVGRGGVLIQCNDCCDVSSRVWIAFPFGRNTSGTQPETPARVVRVTAAPRGGYQIALQLEVPAPGNQRKVGFERRTSARIRFALPIFVRAADSPWPEESMTQDISNAGARFESAHIYSAGDAVLAKIPWGEWENAGEMNARIVRVETAPIGAGFAPRANPATGTSAILNTVCIRWDGPVKKSARSTASPHSRAVTASVSVLNPAKPRR